MQAGSARLNSANQIKMINLSPCNINIAIEEKIYELRGSNSLNITHFNLPIEETNATSLTLKLTGLCSTFENNFIKIDEYITIDKHDSAKRLVFYMNKTRLDHAIISYDLYNQKIGSSDLRFMALDRIDTFNAVITSNKIKSGNFSLAKLANNTKSAGYKSVEYENYIFKVNYKLNNIEKELKGDIILETCGRYTVLLFPSISNDTDLNYLFLTDIHPNGISLLWQIIQIFVMTIGEIMFSISGLAFAYGQAPQSMKSILSASWCLTVALGD